MRSDRPPTLLINFSTAWTRPDPPSFRTPEIPFTEYDPCTRYLAIALPLLPT